MYFIPTPLAVANKIMDSSRPRHLPIRRVGHRAPNSHSNWTAGPGGPGCQGGPAGCQDGPAGCQHGPAGCSRWVMDKNRARTGPGEPGGPILAVNLAPRPNRAAPGNRAPLERQSSQSSNEPGGGSNLATDANRATGQPGALARPLHSARRMGSLLVRPRVPWEPCSADPACWFNRLHRSLGLVRVR